MGSTAWASYLQESSALVPLWTGKIANVIEVAKCLRFIILRIRHSNVVCELVHVDVFCSWIVDLFHYLLFRQMAVFQILWSLLTVKLLNQGLQLQNTYHRWCLYDLLFSLFPFHFEFLPLHPFLFTDCMHYWLVALIFQFNEEARSPFVKKYKTIIHPGEVPILS